MIDDAMLNVCGLAHFPRRTILQAAIAGSGLRWLTPLAESLARAEESKQRGEPAQSVIVLWMAGGPSQFETFDPKPGTSMAAGSLARKTRVDGVQIGSDFEQLADQWHHISLVRSVVSKEGDHERGTYTVKTGWRPDPTLVHPSIGAVVCNQLKNKVEIPRHISILPGQWPARGGYLGAPFDAFKVYDPKGPIPDVVAQVNEPRFQRRVQDLNVVETEFARGRLPQLDANKTLHAATTEAALKMMSSDQLKAFDINQVPASVREPFGDSPFGRGCLAAARLIEVGVRCVEVTLDGWDSHVNNHELQRSAIRLLDPAFAALLRYLEERQRLASTLILWGGEFGRTPQVNPAGGRDHWPLGFTVAMAGGGIRGGQVIGATANEPLDGKDLSSYVQDPHPVGDIHATVFNALGIPFDKELPTPVGRPMKLSEGKPIRELLG